MNKRLALLCLFLSAIYVSTNLNCLAKDNLDKIHKLQTKTNLSLNQNINSLSTLENDQICGYTTKDLTYDYEVMVPSKSLICGKVSKVKRAGRLSKNARLKVAVNQIVTPKGEIFEINNNVDFKITVNKSQSQFKRSLPAGVAYLGTYLPLELATSICSGGANAIGLGAGVVIGTAYGALYPEEGKSRKISAFNGAINATPIGLIRFAAKKGNNFEYQKGEEINVNFSRKELKKLNKIFESNQL